ncbi:DUF1501 domain-containing protein [Gimesia fumaroli]|uniref:DUF1501 domain-containing protein n=1 Tax=Gimesia fumaroli TaxID=2527976 RepID=A0A518IEX6_9PLAN|nr:DUF1501 domain-containing protein [Gimesia fumaroli]QDV51636.1 hypothetical protein Enr17x_36930 [Gimesia fumaroli]
MNQCQNMTRRSALQVGLLGGLGLTLPGFLKLSAARAESNEKSKAKADAVLFLNLAGGVSHLDTLDRKPDAPADTQGEFKSIQTCLPGHQVCEYLPKYAAAADQFSLIRGISHSAGAHPQGQSWISTGNRPVPALIYPSLGSVVTKEISSKPDLPGYVAIPKTEWNAGYMGDAYAPFKTNTVPRPGQPFQVRGISLPDGLTIEKVNQRQELLTKLDRRFKTEATESQLLEALDKFGSQAYNMITSKRARAAFDVEQESSQLRKLFTPDEFSQSVFLGCRLIEFGVPFVTVTYQGWDTHTENFAGHRRLLPALDNGITAGLEMLKQKGLLERTLIVIMGEFGRTPKINVNAGRDHYPRVNWCLMAGGGVKPAKFIGGTTKAGDAPDENTNIKPDDIAATIYHTLGINPLTEYYTNTGRPTMLVPHGRIMSELFA